ncbi:MAG: 7-carboxy-7-deazaguanine synthase, partial [Lentisphaerae bacterium]|nr:7-carboxy-7-deazaguanine synthase [Lentisphaerota bacterium]
ILRPGDIIELTGGEPLLQEDSSALLALLSDLGTVLVETNGTVPLPRSPRCYHAIIDVKCPSSGESGRVVWENLTDLGPRDEVKFVVCDRNDFRWALTRLRDYPLLDQGTPLLFAPVFGSVSAAELAEWILESGLPLRLQLQQHKIIWPDRDRGV